MYYVFKLLIQKCTGNLFELIILLKNYVLKGLFDDVAEEIRFTATGTPFPPIKRCNAGGRAGYRVVGEGRERKALPQLWGQTAKTSF
jgi:hypothetical protein